MLAVDRLTGSDILNEEAAYKSKTGLVHKGDTLYITGTRDVATLRDDVRLLRTNTTAQYRSAKRYLLAHPEVTRVLGHSLGGATALRLARRDPKLFGIGIDPGFTPQEAALWTASKPRNVHIYRDTRDPVSILSAPWASNVDTGSWNPHSLKSWRNSLIDPESTG